MDKVSEEIFGLLSIPLEIFPEEQAESQHEQAEFVERWDLYLRNYSFPTARSGVKIIDWLFFRESFKRDAFFKKIQIVKEALLNKMRFNDSENKPLILIKRAPEPEFYNQETGKAEIKGYGTSRRNLTGLIEAKHEIELKGYTASIVEFGSLTMVEQIKAVTQSSGLVGVRGAEFANLLWLPPGSLVMMICPTNMPNDPPQRALAHICGYTYFEEMTTENSQLVLEAKTVLAWLDKEGKTDDETGKNGYRAG